MSLFNFNYNILGCFVETSTIVGQGPKKGDLLEGDSSSGKNIIARAEVFTGVIRSDKVLYVF